MGVIELKSVINPYLCYPYWRTDSDFIDIDCTVVIYSAYFSVYDQAKYPGLQQSQADLPSKLLMRLIATRSIQNKTKSYSNSAGSVGWARTKFKVDNFDLTIKYIHLPKNKYSVIYSTSSRKGYCFILLFFLVQIQNRK